MSGIIHHAHIMTFTQKWSSTKDAVESSLKKDDKAGAAFLKALYKKFDKGLTKEVAGAVKAKTLCDEYEASFTVAKIAKGYLQIMKNEKNWPGTLTEGKKSLEKMLTTLDDEAVVNMDVLTGKLKKIKTSIFADWSTVRSTSATPKSVDTAIAKWLKNASNGEYNATIKAAMSKGAKTAVSVCGILTDMVKAIDSEANTSVAKESEENALLVLALDSVRRDANSVVLKLDEIKDMILVNFQKVAVRNEKDDKL